MQLNNSTMRRYLPDDLTCEETPRRSSAPLSERAYGREPYFYQQPYYRDTRRTAADFRDSLINEDVDYFRLQQQQQQQQQDCFLREDERRPFRNSMPRGQFEDEQFSYYRRPDDLGSRGRFTSDDRRHPESQQPPAYLDFERVHYDPRPRINRTPDFSADAPRYGGDHHDHDGLERSGRYHSEERFRRSCPDPTRDYYPPPAAATSNQRFQDRPLQPPDSRDRHLDRLSYNDPFPQCSQHPMSSPRISLEPRLVSSRLAISPPTPCQARTRPSKPGAYHARPVCESDNHLQESTIVSSFSYSRADEACQETVRKTGPAAAAKQIGATEACREQEGTKNDGDVWIEIAPGTNARLRSTRETMDAVARDFHVQIDCLSCGQSLFCIADVSYFICRKCKVINPADVNDDAANGAYFEGNPIERHGVGLAFDVDGLFRMQAKLVKKEQKKKKRISM